MAPNTGPRGRQLAGSPGCQPRPAHFDGVCKHRLGCNQWLCSAGQALRQENRQPMLRPPCLRFERSCRTERSPRSCREGNCRAAAILPAQRLLMPEGEAPNAATTAFTHALRAPAVGTPSLNATWSRGRRGRAATRTPAAGCHRKCPMQRSRWRLHHHWPPANEHRNGQPGDRGPAVPVHPRPGRQAVVGFVTTLARRPERCS